MSLKLLKIKIKWQLHNLKVNLGLKQPPIVTPRNSYFGNQPSLEYFQQEK